MKNFTRLVAAMLMLGATTAVQAQQDHHYKWSSSVGSNQTEHGRSVAVDKHGNTYVTGYFRGTTDFDPGPGVANLTVAGGADVFVQKLDPSGDFVWVMSMGGTADDVAQAIEVNDAGEIFVAGYFSGTADFDPGAGTANLTSNGSSDGFVVKLNADGTYAWAHAMGSTGGEGLSGLACDASGGVATSGFFLGSIDADPGTGTTTLTSNGQADAIIQKFDASGALEWAVNIGGTTNDDYRDVAIDGSGNVIASGYISGTADMDPGIATDNLTPAGGSDIVVHKFDANGVYIWAEIFGGTSNDSSIGLTVDNGNNIITTGVFIGTADFDNGTGTQNITSQGNNDIFVHSMDSNGVFNWAAAAGSSLDDNGFSVAVDEQQNVYATGFFRSTATFDAGTGTGSVTSNGNADIFIEKLDNAGNLQWVKNIGGAFDDHAFEISVTPKRDVVMAGYYNATVDFDPGAGTSNEISNGSSDIFAVSLKDCTDSTTQVINTCGDYTWIDGNTYTSNNFTATHTMTNENGCDSVITLHLTIDEVVDQGASFTSTAGCDSTDVIINTASSENGVQYWLRDNANDTIVDGPVTGDGSALSFNGGMIYQNMTYNVYAEKTIDKAVTFDGTNLERLEVEDPYSEFESEMTVEAWVYFDASTADDMPWMGQAIQGVDGPGNVWVWHNAGNEIEFYVNDGGVWKTVVSTNVGALAGWHHIATVASPSGLELFIDGVSDGTGAGITTKINNEAASVMHIGGDPRFSTNPAYHGNCQISEVRIWNSARTQTEIQNTYNNCLNGNESGLVYYNKLNDGTGNTATASVGDNAMMSVSMDPSTDWTMGANTCEGQCTFEMTQTVDANVLLPTTSSVTVSECISYTVPSGDETYTTTGVYMDTITNAVGCDSIMTIDVTINTVDVNVTNSDPSISADAAGLQYQWLDCGNNYAVISGETSQSFTATANGDYAVEVTDNGCVDTSACVAIASVGFEEHNPFNIAMYPNPTEGNLWIENPNLESELNLEIRSLDGKVVYQTNLSNGKDLIQLGHLSAGVYMVEITDKKQKFIGKIRLF